MTTELFGVRPFSPRILFVTTLVLSLAAHLRHRGAYATAAGLEAVRALRTEWRFRRSLPHHIV